MKTQRRPCCVHFPILSQFSTEESNCANLIPVNILCLSYFTLRSVKAYMHSKGLQCALISIRLGIIYHYKHADTSHICALKWKIWVASKANFFFCLQISRVSKMLADEYGTASIIKSRVNRLSVLGAITSVQHRLKLYTKVPPNGLVPIL